MSASRKCGSTRFPTRRGRRLSSSSGASRGKSRNAGRVDLGEYFCLAHHHRDERTCRVLADSGFQRKAPRPAVRGSGGNARKEETSPLPRLRTGGEPAGGGLPGMRESFRRPLHRPDDTGGFLFIIAASAALIAAVVMAGVGVGILDLIAQAF